MVSVLRHGRRSALVRDPDRSERRVADPYAQALDSGGEPLPDGGGPARHGDDRRVRTHDGRPEPADAAGPSVRGFDGEQLADEHVELRAAHGDAADDAPAGLGLGG